MLTGDNKQLTDNITSIHFKGYNDNKGNPVDNCLNFINMSDIDTSAITNMRGMFMGLKHLTGINADFDTSAATDLSYMFSGCTELRKLELNRFDTSACTNVNRMFRGCVNLESINLRYFDMSKVTIPTNMFYDCPVKYITCTQAFKDWCETNQTTLGLVNFNQIHWTIMA